MILDIIEMVNPDSEIEILKEIYKFYHFPCMSTLNKIKMLKLR